ncbi:MAG TPA: hypothetical protein VJZ71_05220 [Phycisphaerae bacterium]|nr:hypothetical protein [Phycisphaerae bacterium]
MTRYAFLTLLLALPAGCQRDGVIEVDLTAQPPRFIVHHRGWPAPFHWPRVTEFAIASEEDGGIWVLRSATSEGEPARQLAFVFGEVPPGFVQLTPDKAARVRPLVVGRTYFVAAGGPTYVYRIVFALPVDTWTPVQPSPTTSPAVFPAN